MNTRTIIGTFRFIDKYTTCSMLKFKYKPKTTKNLKIDIQ